MNTVFDYNYVVTGDIIALLLCFVVHFLLKSTYMVKRTNLNIFRTANRLIGTAAVSSLVYHHIIENLTRDDVVFLYLFRGMSYSALFFTYICFCVYIKNLTEMSRKYEKLFIVTMYGSGILFTLVEYLGPIFKLGFYVDKDMQIHQNYYTDIFRYAYVYYSMCIIFMLYAYRKKFIPRMYHCIWCVLAVSVGLMVYQAEFEQTSYTVVSFTFPVIMVLFLFHYNSYDVGTGTLDYYAFEEYVQEKLGKSFSLIFLSLPSISRDQMIVFSKNFLRKNDSFFNASCCFRLRDNRLVLVYQKEKNKDYQDTLNRMYREFKRECGKNDYRIVLMESNGLFLNASEYIKFCEFTENRMPINKTRECDEKLLSEFMKEKFIYLNLKDIAEKGNLDDYRVKAFCQPVWNTSTNRFTTAEALMRLDLPEVGMVFPDQFIPIAEKADFIHSLSLIILNKTCKTIRELEEQGYVIDRVSVNFSVQELHMESFCDDIIGIIENHGIDFGKIAIELTETRNEKDFYMMKDIIHSLQEKGIKFYLDDFGTGYSNFERLIGLPIDIIKFDRSLTILSSKNDESKFMVGSFSEIFKKAEYQILFEGVEDETDEKRCINMNAQYLQGYKYSKPIPMEQLKDFLEKRPA